MFLKRRLRVQIRNDLNTMVESDLERRAEDDVPLLSVQWLVQYKQYI